MKPKISIIIPVYNTEIYLPQCIESVLNQPYREIEVILVDDGSPDSCPQICDKYAELDDRVSVIHKDNGGLSDARNHGILKATGEYIMFLDSDDYWIDQVNLEKFVSELEKNSAIDFLIFGMRNFYQKTNKTVLSRAFPKKALSAHLNKIEKLSLLQSLGIFPMSACDKVIRRSFIFDSNLFFKKGYTAEDVLWFIEIAKKAHNFLVMNEYIYVYRKEVEGAITSNTNTLISLSKIVFDLSDENRYREDDFSKITLGYMAYEYLILLAFSESLPSTINKELRKYKWLLKYDNNKKVKISHRIIRILGYRLTTKILRSYIKQIKKIK